VYALVSFFDFFLAAFELPGVVSGVVAPLGESRSKLGPADGVVEPVRAGDCKGESFEVGDGKGSVGDVTRDFSLPVTASDIARSPNWRFAKGLTGNSQSEPLADRLSADFEASLFSMELLSNLVTIGDAVSRGGVGRGGLIREVSEGVRRRPFTVRP
jgi:hypothetical protein